MVLFLFIPFILGYLIKRLFAVKLKSIENKHVVITGGSSGIGKSLAVLAAQKGADVTIIARDVDKLNVAIEEVKSAFINEKQKVQAVSLDVSDDKAVEQKFKEIEKFGSIYMLINCAGMAICGKLEDLSVGDIKTLINVNYYGTVFPIKSVVPLMKKRKEGIIVLTSSQAGLVGVFGYSAYSASKFALRGLAESLDMELNPHNVSVTISLPPDTDTPGYENENKSKPLETTLIGESAGLFHPDVIAKKLLNDALSGKFLSSSGFEGFLITTVCVGMSRFSSVFEVLLQSLILGPIRIICCFYLASFHRIVKNCLEKENKEK